MFRRLLILLLTMAPGLAWPDQSVSVDYDESLRPLGTCLADSSRSCAGPDQCEGKRNYCVRAPRDSDPTSSCYKRGPGCSANVTFRFDKDYETGTFLDGQPYVVSDAAGRLTITAITPEHTPGCVKRARLGCRHGVGIDMEAGTNTLDSGARVFEPRSPTWPHTIDVSDGIPSCVLKVVSFPEGKGRGDTAFLFSAMLTVVKAKPPPSAFRPNCMGRRKIGFDPYFTIDDVHFPRIPNLRARPPQGGPSIDDIDLFWTGSPHIGFQARNSEVGPLMTLNQSSIFLSGKRWNPALGGITSSYHSARVNRTNAALLRMTFSDFNPGEDERHARVLFHAIQHGLDKIGMALGYGELPARRSTRTKNFAAPMMFSAYLLDNINLITGLSWESFVEMDTIIHSPKPGVGSIFGNGGCEEDAHWRAVLGNLRGAESAKECKWLGDPYGYVDQLFFSYQRCCSTGPWEAGALLTYLLGMERYAEALGIEKWLQYQDRFRVAGLKAIGDPCAGPPRSVIKTDCQPPDCPGYRSEWGPAEGNKPDCAATSSCRCIGHGGDPNRQGRNTALNGDTTTWWSFSWNREMWDRYRKCASPMLPDGTPSRAYPCKGITKPPKAAFFRSATTAAPAE